MCRWRMLWLLPRHQQPHLCSCHYSPCRRRNRTGFPRCQGTAAPACDRRLRQGPRKKGEERLDYIFIDCPPSLGLLTVNAFCAAGEVLIPIQCEYYALEGLSQLLKNIEMIQKHLNADLVVSTILLTMYDGRTNLAAQVAAEVRQHFPDQVLGAVVPRSVRISEAPSYQQTVMTYDPSSSGALSYLEAAAEIAER